MSRVDGQKAHAIESPPELRVALALKLKGLAEVDVLERVTGLACDTLDHVLAAASDAGSAAHRCGRIGGWHLTVDGREWLDGMLDAERSALVGREGIERCYKGFLELNAGFKEFCTRWQQEPEAELVAPAYAEELGGIHDRLAAVLVHGERELVRLGRYRTRFAAARDRFVAGDVAALTRPLNDSYHDIWMELHQDLLSTLGRERRKADGH